MGFICNSDAVNSKAGKATGEPTGPVAIDEAAMRKFKNLTAAAVVLASLGPAPVLAQDLVTKSVGLRHVTQGGYGRPIWYYDGRGDTRDFPTNGFFPGDFAADPASASIGAAGIFGNAPSRAPAAARSVTNSARHRSAGADVRCCRR